MLLSLLTPDRVQFASDAADWENAIKTAAEPLLRDGCISAPYIDAMIRSVKEFGPYIVLMPNIAMPHARPDEGVHRLGTSLLVLDKPAVFPGGKEARVFWVLAAPDASAHLSLLTAISTLLSDSAKTDTLVSLTSYSALTNLLQEEST